MSVQRLTTASQSDAVRVSGGEVAFREDGRPPVDIQSISQVGRDGAWRTEAMRSYDRPVLVWFTRGQGRFTVSGRTFGFGAHNLVFLPPGTMHGFSTMGATTGSIAYLSSSLRWPEEALHLRLTDAKMQREMTALIEDIRREAEIDEMDTGLALFHRAGLLSVWIRRTLARFDAEDNAPRRKVRAGDRLTAAFTKLVEEEFREPVGVQHFAERLGVTPTHLTRVCRQTTGRPALDILNDRRHFEARKLLRDSRMKIAEVAKMSGFSSAAYFTRAFRSETGQSPSEFRLGH